MNTDKIYAESIAKEYAPKNDSKITALRKLDAKAKKPANIFAYTFGIITTLVAGLGMCLSMQVIGGTALLTAVGIVIGIIGFIGMGVNYSIYKKMLENEKIDIVHICTPHYLHAEMVIEALKRGVNVICEKPLCIGMEELSKIGD